MGLADFDFLPSVPWTFWGFPPFLYLPCTPKKKGGHKPGRTRTGQAMTSWKMVVRWPYFGATSRSNHVRPAVRPFRPWSQLRAMATPIIHLFAISPWLWPEFLWPLHDHSLWPELWPSAHHLPNLLRPSYDHFDHFVWPSYGHSTKTKTIGWFKPVYIATNICIAVIK